MSSVLLANNRKIGDYLRPYIIAELNTSHFGNLSTAKEMIYAAKDVGCDCVKFQSWSANTLYCDEYYEGNKITKRIVSRFSFGEDDLLQLSRYCATLSIDFASTPYSLDEAKFLVNSCRVPFIKVASMEINNIPYLEDLARLNIPLILSTGMSDIQEIRTAVAHISRIHKNFAILHCTSLYPTLPGDINLLNIQLLRDNFPSHPIGFSDHSIGHQIPTAAIGLGASIIEKHFTLDSSKIGMDNQMATEPNEMRMLVKSCHLAHEAIGSYQRVLTQDELEQSMKMRRSIVAKYDLKAGATLDTDAVEFKRPGNGIAPSDLNQYLGKVLTKDVRQGFILAPNHFE